MNKFTLAAGLLLCAVFNANAQTLELVKEISSGSSNPYLFTVAAGKLFFVAKDDANQFRLYVTDGTPATTQLLGPSSAVNGSISNLIGYNGKLFFSCNDNINGQELWTSDGTPAGTVLFKDLYPGATGSFPTAFTVANNKLLFMGNGVNGERRLYVSDGTAGGTFILKDYFINLFNGFSDFAVMNNYIYFISDNGTGVGNGMWKSNGTAAGTVLVKGDFSPGVAGGNYAVLNNKMYFSGWDLVNGSELWVTDGTDPGTHIVVNLGTDGGGVLNGGFPQALTVFQGKIYFSAKDDTHGNELFVTDGTAAGTQLVKDIVPGTDGSQPYQILIYNGLLYIDCWYQHELWKSDGTAAGTELVKAVPEFTRFGAVWNNKIYMIAGNTTYLWQSDGTAAGTDYAKATNSNVLIGIYATDTNLTIYNSALYFGGSNSDISPSTEPLRLQSSAIVHNFSFTGSGNWSNPANWAGNVPPSTLMAGDNVVINGNCILDVAVHAQPGSSITVAAGKSLVIVGSLTIV